MFSALLRRELVTPLRRPQMIAFQIGLAALFALLIAARWPSDGQVAMLGTRSQQIFRLFSYGLMGMLLLLLPVFPATSVVSEKKSGTLALLFNTPLGAGRIFVAKLLAVLGLAGMIIAMSLPAAGACYTMGGLSLYEDIGKVYLLLSLVALQYAAIGLLVSSYSQSVDAAIRLTYGIVLGTSILTLGPHYFFQGTGGIWPILVNFLRCLSPLAALTSLTGAADIGGQGLATKTDVMGNFTVWSLLCAAGASIWTISRLNHRIFDQSRAAGTMSDDLSSSGQLLRRLFFLVDPQKRTGGIPSFLNPVMVKEFRSRKFGRLHWLVRLTAVCGILSLGLTYATTAGTFDWGVETIGGIMVIMQVALIVLIAPSLSAGILSVEREHGAWQLTADNSDVHDPHYLGQTVQCDSSADADSLCDHAGLSGDGVHRTGNASSGESCDCLPGINGHLCDVSQRGGRLFFQPIGCRDGQCLWRSPCHLLPAAAGLDGARCSIRTRRRGDRIDFQFDRCRFFRDQDAGV